MKEVTTLKHQLKMAAVWVRDLQRNRTNEGENRGRKEGKEIEMCSKELAHLIMEAGKSQDL